MLKSDNLQYNMLGRWDKRRIDQASDVQIETIFAKNLARNYEKKKYLEHQTFG